MIKKSITYTDFDDNEVQEDHYFHLSKADVIRMEVTFKEGLEAWVTRVSKSVDKAEILKGFEDLVRLSYGTRTPEGKFSKDPHVTEVFMASEAYSEFLMGLLTNADAAGEWVNGIMPKGLDKDIARIQAQNAAQTVAEIVAEPAPPETKVLTLSEAQEMDEDELKSGLITGRYKLS